MKVLLISIFSVDNFYTEIESKTNEELYEFAKKLNNTDRESALIFNSLKDFEDELNYNSVNRDLKAYYVKFINL